LGQDKSVHQLASAYAQGETTVNRWSTRIPSLRQQMSSQQVGRDQKSRQAIRAQDAANTPSNTRQPWVGCSQCLAPSLLRCECLPVTFRECACVRNQQFSLASHPPRIATTRTKQRHNTPLPSSGRAGSTPTMGPLFKEMIGKDTLPHCSKSLHRQQADGNGVAQVDYEDAVRLKEKGLRITSQAPDLSGGAGEN